MAPPTNNSTLEGGIRRNQRAKKPSRVVKPSACEECRRKKISCKGYPGETCEGCLKSHKVCCRTGVDHRSNNTNQAILDATMDAFKDIYDDYFTVLHILSNPHVSNEKTMAMSMLLVATPSTFLQATGTQHPQRTRRYPAFCDKSDAQRLLAQTRNTQKVFSETAWLYLRKLHTLVDGIVRARLDQFTQSAIRRLVDVGLSGFGGAHYNLIDALESEHVVLHPLAEDALLASYRDLLLEHRGLSLQIPPPAGEVTTPNQEVVLEQEVAASEVTTVPYEAVTPEEAITPEEVMTSADILMLQNAVAFEDAVPCEEPSAFLGPFGLSGSVTLTEPLVVEDPFSFEDFFLL